jgi:hypothetical protein
LNGKANSDQNTGERDKLYCNPREVRRRLTQRPLQPCSFTRRSSAQRNAQRDCPSRYSHAGGEVHCSLAECHVKRAKLSKETTSKICVIWIHGDLGTTCRSIGCVVDTVKANVRTSNLPEARSYVCRQPYDGHRRLPSIPRKSHLCGAESAIVLQSAVNCGGSSCWPLGTRSQRLAER